MGSLCHAGELHGPPPVPRQVRRITVTVEQLPDGRWRFTQPHLPGWARVARNAVEVPAVLRAGFTEAQVATYSHGREHVYDAGVPLYRRARPAAKSATRCDVYDPRMWRLVDENRWISPKGHVYPECRQVVQRVMAARVGMGLSPRPDPVQPGTARSAQSLSLVASGRPA